MDIKAAYIRYIDYKKQNFTNKNEKNCSFYYAFYAQKIHNMHKPVTSFNDF